MSVAAAGDHAVAQRLAHLQHHLVEGVQRQRDVVLVVVAVDQQRLGDTLPELPQRLGERGGACTQMAEKWLGELNEIRRVRMVPERVCGVKT